MKNAIYVTIFTLVTLLSLKLTFVSSARTGAWTSIVRAQEAGSDFVALTYPVEPRRKYVFEWTADLETWKHFRSVHSATYDFVTIRIPVRHMLADEAIAWRVRDDGPVPRGVGWTPPTTNEDGSDLDDLEGYRVYNHGQQVSYVSAAEYSPDIFDAGDYLFTVTAVDSNGNESVHSEALGFSIPFAASNEVNLIWGEE